MLCQILSVSNVLLSDDKGVFIKSNTFRVDESAKDADTEEFDNGSRVKVYENSNKAEMEE